ncbi:hypothetical protein UFOVP255_9 [uncultured Caudovirales phage]|uniref:Uncharacterized protein n=1 Tax=uncultured Caudovirales phage TaxID=2100421 RepID=A0A6J5LCP9_9CAUD|nr:hypothetical protein UFOVP255_9 [uncultured Caudovirales phage]
MEYSKLASGTITVTATSTAQNVPLPFLPHFIEISNPTRATAVSGVTRAWWTNDLPQASGMVVTTGTGPADGTSYVTSGGFSTFSAGYPQYGSQIAIASISKHSTAPVVTTTGSHGLSTGNVVLLTGLFQSSSTGMPQISGIPFTITVTASTTFTIAYNTNQSNYTALSGSPTGAYVVQVLYPSLYFPGTNVISAASLSGTSLTVTTTTPHNLVVNSQVAFRIPSAWGSSQLNTPYSGNNLGQPVYGLISSITSAYIYVCTLTNVSSITAFTTNVTVASALAGLTFPQSVAVGDQNTGALTSSYTPTTINPISIGGAFQNNTQQGFIIGSSVVGTAADTIVWRAYGHDLVSYVG